MNDNYELILEAAWRSFSGNIDDRIDDIRKQDEYNPSDLRDALDTRAEMSKKWQDVSWLIISGRVTGDPSSSYRNHDMSRNAPNRMACYLNDSFGVDIISRVYDSEADKTLLLLQGGSFENVSGKLVLFADEERKVAYITSVASGRTISAPIQEPF